VFVEQGVNGLVFTTAGALPQVIRLSH